MSRLCRRTRVIDRRGNSDDRRRRKEWMVSAAAGFGGDSLKVPCWECGKMLTVDQVVADRIDGAGTYRRINIRGPHCALCSHRQGQRQTVALLAARRAAEPYDDTDHCKSCRRHYLALHKPDCPLIAPCRPGW